MALPHARKVTVDGQVYPYLLKYGKGRLIGDSGPTIAITIQIDKGYLGCTFESKKWTRLHEEHLDNAEAHKASFKPSDVCAVIRAWKGQLLAYGFELPEWTVTAVRETGIEPVINAV